MTLKQRLAPFLVLLEARYLPLMFLALPQAYTVALWLSESNHGRWGDVGFAIIGAAAFEFTYVGAIAWAEGKTSGRWVWGTAFLALIFSVLVAIKVYQNEGWWSLLHAGFPIVAFGYTMVTHSSSQKGEAQPGEAQSAHAAQVDVVGLVREAQASLERNVERRVAIAQSAIERSLSEVVADLPDLIRREVMLNTSAAYKPPAADGGDREPVALAEIMELPELAPAPVMEMRATAQASSKASPAVDQAAIERGQQVRAMREKNMTWDEIAAQFGVAKRTVQNWAAKE